jgi:hypothetical protein
LAWLAAAGGGGSGRRREGRAFRAMLPLPVLSRRLLSSLSGGLLFGRGDPIVPDAGPAHRTILTKYKEQGEWGGCFACSLPRLKR